MVKGDLEAGKAYMLQLSYESLECYVRTPDEVERSNRHRSL